MVELLAASAANPMSEEDIQAAERIMDAANRLELGGIIFLIAVLILGLIAFILWLKSKSDAAKAANERLSIEQQGKRDRAKMYIDSTAAQTSAISNLSEQISGMRSDASEHSRDLGSMLNAQNDRLAQQIREHEESAAQREMTRDQRLTEVFGSLQLVMDELLDRQKGVINLDDSLRLVEECFERSIKPQAVSIAEQSLKTNHWQRDKVYIEERVMQELSSMFYHADRGLTNYQLSIDHKLFFPASPGGPFDLALTFWKIVKELHEDGINEGVELPQRLRSVRIRIERAANALFNEARQATLRIYRNGDGDGGGGIRFTTPRPEDPEA